MPPGAGNGGTPVARIDSAWQRQNHKLLERASSSMKEHLPTIKLGSVILATVVALGCHPSSRLPRSTTAPQDLEVIGLQSWSVRMLSDSVSRYRPGTTLRDAACAEILRDSLGFPDAAVLRFRDGRVVLMVVEPQHAERVSLRTVGTGVPPVPGPWDSLAVLLGMDPFAVELAAVNYGRRQHGERPMAADVDTSLVEATWEILLDSLGVPPESAMRVLRTDPRPQARQAAAFYLLRSHEDDGAWIALTEALRDADWSVRTAANTVLRIFRTSVPRRVDWSPAVNTLSYLLAGTTVTFHIDVVRTLIATEVDPALAPVLLSRGAMELLRDEACARHEFVRAPAEALLRVLGRDSSSHYPVESPAAPCGPEGNDQGP